MFPSFGMLPVKPRKLLVNHAKLLLNYDFQSNIIMYTSATRTKKDDIAGFPEKSSFTILLLVITY
ncbi:hypothetical protein JFL43_08060 [Viridibacillus sp. YIM B01967]|uniref:Uncharacterized protein n=1 Tax=Viridibacillus soli TaxID=2798301 RepID=A0ABS1H5W3_9BACL|nr:hypothetical protein [Viridibacillus soli]MBK3494813.1 hypothetical protein [Viridibacillus soli]